MDLFCGSMPVSGQDFPNNLSSFNVLGAKKEKAHCIHKKSWSQICWILYCTHITYRSLGVRKTLNLDHGIEVSIQTPLWASSLKLRRGTLMPVSAQTTVPLHWLTLQTDWPTERTHSAFECIRCSWLHGLPLDLVLNVLPRVKTLATLPFGKVEGEKYRLFLILWLFRISHYNLSPWGNPLLY